jgi:hypothetical protein
VPERSPVELPYQRRRYIPIGNQPNHSLVALGSHAADHTRPSVPTTNTSSLSVLRDTAVTGAPAAACPPLIFRQACQPSVNPGSQEPVRIEPFTSVAKISSLSVPREAACTGAPAGTRMSRRTRGRAAAIYFPPAAPAMSKNRFPGRGKDDSVFVRNEDIQFVLAAGHCRNLSLRGHARTS